jgi:hypothetical protein
MEPSVIIILVGVFTIVFSLQLFALKTFLKRRREALKKH